jgi:cytochrome o ubiquinol oxidase subunit 3
MSDCFLFASLFATYAVLQGATFGGPGGHELFSLPFVLTETLILLTSSFTMGLAMYFAHHGKKVQVLWALLATLGLGLWFLGLEISEFRHFIQEGNSWTRSAFLSAFFTLVGTHGAHIAFGIIGMVVLAGQIMYSSLTPQILRRLLCLSLFWHFLDIVWIFIFSFVYLMGVL